MKRDTPITAAQVRYLNALLVKHGLQVEEKVESMTKSSASRLIDRIISQYGK